MTKKPETAEEVMTQALWKIVFVFLVVIVAIVAVAVL